MILTYKHPSTFHTQIYPPIHLSIPPHPVHGYFFIYLFTYPLMNLLIHLSNHVSTHLSKHYLSCHPSTHHLFFPLYLHFSIRYPPIHRSLLHTSAIPSIHPPSHPIRPHSFISLFPHYFPFHLPPLLPSLSITIMFTESWHILRAMRASIRCRMCPVTDAQVWEKGHSLVKGEVLVFGYVVWAV